MDVKAVGQRIKTAREKKNMTQEDLAALIDISPAHISVIERGTKIPRIDTFAAIANALGVSADELLVDVVDHASSGVASELSAAIEDLPRDEKMRVLKVISALLDRLAWKSNQLFHAFFLFAARVLSFSTLYRCYTRAKERKQNLKTEETQ